MRAALRVVSAEAAGTGLIQLKGGGAGGRHKDAVGRFPPQPAAAAEVEAPVKAVVVMVSGLATAAAGAFIRSCTQDIPAAFANAWCGDAPLQIVSASHAHCAGCAMTAAGLALIVLSAILTTRSGGHLAGATP